MKTRALFLTACFAGTALVVAGVASTSAQDSRPGRISGVIHDYAPTGVTAPDGTPTAWELHGPWNLTFDKSGTAHFSTSLTMGLSVLGQSSTDIQDTILAQHTHNITMDGTVTYNPTDCPAAAAATPAYTARIEIKSSGAGASVFANGNVPPFGQFSPLQVCLSGGVVKPNEPIVPLSNITLVFGGGAAGHFGGFPIHGAVTKTKPEDRDGFH